MAKGLGGYSVHKAADALGVPYLYFYGVLVAYGIQTTTVHRGGRGRPAQLITHGQFGIIKKRLQEARKHPILGFISAP